MHGARSHPVTLQSQPVRARPVPLGAVVLLAICGALGLGLMGHVTGEHAFRGSWEFSRLGGPWLCVAFAGGVVSSWRRAGEGLLLGAATGAVLISAGSLAYYALSYWGGDYGARSAAALGIGWGLAGIGVGGALGLLGAASSTTLGRHRTPSTGRPVASWLHGAALGTLGGLLMGEAIALLWVWDGSALRTMAALEGLGGAALVVAGCVGRKWRFVVAAFTAPRSARRSHRSRRRCCARRSGRSAGPAPDTAVPWAPHRAAAARPDRTWERRCRREGRGWGHGRAQWPARSSRSRTPRF